MIEEGFLDQHRIEDLADSLGIGGRHLSRLFKRHLGASPIDIASTRRIQMAKRLITDTNMAMADVAFESGFNSIRRFNDAFKSVYKRPPSSLRR